MKRGDAAREEVKNQIIKAFGEHALGVQDKKIFVEVQDGPGGEWIQFAITMTMPKTGFVKSAETEISGSATPSQISDEDAKKVAELMERLGIPQGA